MDRRQRASEAVVMLQPQHPHAYYPSSSGQSVQQGPYNQGPLPGQTVVTMQTEDFEPAAPLSDHLCYSIFTMLCCCSPLGIAALVFSLSTRNANGAGHRELAVRNSKTARTLNNTACCLGIVLIVFIVVFELVLLEKLKNLNYLEKNSQN
nr:synapse differentiation-inducing gene protein 1-like [Danio rerio]|eukprot:XP_009290908.1 synapse differentiation-inducing gene protein 1-like [Danio rerio]